MIEAVVVEMLESAPPDATHWTTRRLATKHGDQPHHGERSGGPWADTLASRKLQGVARPRPGGKDPRSGRALHQPTGGGHGVRRRREPQIQALNRTAPTVPMLPTTPARATHDYERNGTCDLFAALNVTLGTVITDIRKSHISASCIAFCEQGEPRSPRRTRRTRDLGQPADSQGSPGPPLCCCPTAGSTSTSPRLMGRGWISSNGGSPRSPPRS